MNQTINHQINNGAEPNLEHLWQFAGQGLRSSDFNTAMVHFYRGELTRSNVWRQRLDNTTNWAVITTGAALTFAFGSADNPSIVLLINTLLVLLFLFMEARRYRYYELWTHRVRILERNFFGGLLSPPFLPHSDWANQLTDSLHNPRFPISLLEAFGRRYRRNYAPIFLILALAWIAKTYLHPINARTFSHFLQRATIGPLPGTAVLIIGIVIHATLISVGLFTVSLQAATGEVFSDTTGKVSRIMHMFRLATAEALETDLPRLVRTDTRKQLVYIISDSVEAIGHALLEDLHRGVTLLHGTGMYTGQEHGVLMCALEARQVADLKKVVTGIDPDAFVIIMPVQGIHGHGVGFRPLEA